MTSPLPPHLDPGGRRLRVGEPRHDAVAFLGIVRDYKGLDDLVDATALNPNLQLRVHGEFWTDVEELRAHVNELGLTDRVHIDDRFVPDEELPSLFDDVDAMVLPYRSGTASQLVLVAHRLGLPVIATTVGSFPDQIDHDRNGLLCPPNEPEALASTIRSLADEGRLDRLRRGAYDVPPPDHLWVPYLHAVAGP